MTICFIHSWHSKMFYLLWVLVFNVGACICVRVWALYVIDVPIKSSSHYSLIIVLVHFFAHIHWIEVQAKYRERIELFNCYKSIILFLKFTYLWVCLLCIIHIEHGHWTNYHHIILFDNLFVFFLYCISNDLIQLYWYVIDFHDII